MRFGTGFILSGALWSLIAITLAGISLTLITGLPATPVILAGLLAGAANAATILQRSKKTRNNALYLTAFAVSFVVMMLVSFAAPFSLSLSLVPVIQAAAIILVCLGVTLGNRAAISDIESGALRRYTIEVLLVRVLKGLGFVFFTIIVVLPFYVMVMTSLKSQQQLLLNPLDLSINFAQGLPSLFNAYVELFTRFNFGRFLLISSIVSVSTVLITLAFAIPGAYAVARLRFPGQAFLSRLRKLPRKLRKLVVI